MSKKEYTLKERVRKGLESINIRQGKQNGDHSSKGDADNVCMNGANKTDKTDSPMTPQQPDFKMLVQEIQRAAADGFQNLIQVTCTIDLPVLDLDENVNFCWDELRFDVISEGLLPADIKEARYRAIKTIGDGNCLFRAASILAFGNQHRYEEMRVRTVFELVSHSHFYQNGKDVERILLAQARDQMRQNAGGMDSKLDKLSPQDVKREFESDVLNAARNSAWASYWDLQALGTVLNRRVQSVYPDSGTNEIRRYFNTIIYPRLCDNEKEPLRFMWTHTNGGDISKFRPNHFVPLISASKIPALKPEDHKPGGPYCEETGDTNQVTKSGLKSVTSASCVKDIIFPNPFVMDQVCLKLDHPVKGIPRSHYWPHFAFCFDVSEETAMQCQRDSEYKPSARMFAYLSAKSPKLTINELKGYLGKIHRRDLVSILNESKVEGTEHLNALMDQDPKTFRDICLRLDCGNLHNWQELGAEMKIPVDILEKCECPENYTEVALGIIFTRNPTLTVREMKDALKGLRQHSVCTELSELSDENTIKTLLENATVLEKVTTLLDKETPQGNWKEFAQKFGVSKEECDYMCPDKVNSPTSYLMEHLAYEREELTLEPFIEALLQIERQDVVYDALKKFFDHTDIDCIVEAINRRRLGTGLRMFTLEKESPPSILR